ncbi:MAG: DUF2927 domain-containing protein [Pikeienuella sp.]
MFFRALAVIAFLSACASPAPRAAKPVTLPTEQGGFAAAEEDLVEHNKLRTEIAPADAPFDAETLARNFERIALNTEFSSADGQVIKQSRSVRLARWTKPILLRVEGANDADYAELGLLIPRLEAATGLPIRLTGARSDITIYFMNAEHRRALQIALKRKGKTKTRPLLTAWSGRSAFPCIGEFFAGVDSSEIKKAEVYIKDELSPLLRRMCLNEELTQTLGLRNDHDDVRPSIFNDDQEFALLTTHDEALLRMLYDPALQPGMTAEQVRPHLAAVAAQAVE